MLIGVAGLMTFGFWKIGKGIREQKCVHLILSMLWRMNIPRGMGTSQGMK